ncbi:MAG: type II toxin-antitoxin system RelE/ParE family toxin [Xanthobacteraceae bacterium]|jgi:addiction module RelE/StbE family toxin
MKVRLTRPALDDLERIHGYISKDNPAAASRVVTRLIDRALDLAHAPYQGREVDEPNTRVVVVPRYRYFIFYTIDGDEIHITHFRHTSRRRPWDVE